LGLSYYILLIVPFGPGVFLLNLRAQVKSPGGKGFQFIPGIIFTLLKWGTWKGHMGIYLKAQKEFSREKYKTQGGVKKIKKKGK